MKFSEPHLSLAKRFSYQTEHIRTTKLQKVII